MAASTRGTCSELELNWNAIDFEISTGEWGLLRSGSSTELRTQALRGKYRSGLMSTPGLPPHSKLPTTLCFTSAYDDSGTKSIKTPLTLSSVPNRWPTSTFILDISSLVDLSETSLSSTPPDSFILQATANLCLAPLRPSLLTRAPPTRRRIPVPLPPHATAGHLGRLKLRRRGFFGRVADSEKSLEAEGLV
ncbi:hypothetical protein R3P38DRAFT_3245203 [Favolaschia claudopus]|uniref:Uncharacterized protein n=1 Tax=Favolaschia claudopus TaxID=2862362 RepID=A0AAV9Z0S0_9AGAR